MSALKQKSRRLGIRAGLLTGASAAVLAIGGLSAGTAAAAPTCPTVTPKDTQGYGSSLQKILNEKLTGRAVPSVKPTEEPLPAIPHAAVSGGYAGKCGTSPTVSYSSTGSGPGLTAFRFNGTGSIEHALSFIGTDDAPNAGQIENAENATEGKVASGANPLIIPVAETSIAVVVHLPTGCEIKGGITWQDLNQLFNGKIKTWAGLSTDNGATACNAEITRVVRKEGSGTTYQFKNYLSTLETTSGIAAEGPGCGLGTWASLEKIGTPAEEEKPNTTWPTCNGGKELVRAAGGGALAEYVAKNENTIGYASLPDAKAKGATAANLQNANPEGGKTYGAPGKTEGSTNLSNCGPRVYTVPAAGRKGSGTGESVDWSGVFGASPKVGGTLYPLCTLTYDIGWSSYTKAGYSTSATAYKEVMRDYFINYVLASEGKAIVNNNWYQALPAPTEAEHNVLGAAELAASKLG